MESALVLLAVLACPVGMGLMMWFMSKGMMGGSRKEEKTPRSTSVEELRREQARLTAEIDQLEQNGSQASDRSAGVPR